MMHPAVVGLAPVFPMRLFKLKTMAFSSPFPVHSTTLRVLSATSGVHSTPFGFTVKYV